jgi:hypothetical protein
MLAFVRACVNGKLPDEHEFKAKCCPLCDIHLLPQTSDFLEGIAALS